MSLFSTAWKGFCRRRKTSLTIALMLFVICSALIFCNLILQVCELCRARNENPYSDYYRLVVDRRNIALGNEGFSNQNRMYCGRWNYIRDIHEYFYNIVDYTAEVTGQAITSLQTVSYDWMSDHGYNYVLLYGLTDCKELSEFAKGELILTQGRYLSYEDRAKDSAVCMISEELATLNKVTVGDTIQIRMRDNTDVPYEVIGIYRDTLWRNTSTTTLSYNLQINRIYVPLTTFEHASALDCYNYQILLDNDDLIDEIEQKVNDYYMTQGHPAHFIRVSEIYEGNNSGARALSSAFGAVRGGFVLIAMLLMVIFTHSLLISRRREIGIYLGMGYKKRNVACVLSMEILLPMLAGTILSCVLALLCGRHAAEWILFVTTQSSSTEALRNTTLDMIVAVQNELQALQAGIGASFIPNCIVQAILPILIILILSLCCSSISVLRICVMRLLTKQEDV